MFYNAFFDNTNILTIIMKVIAVISWYLLTVMCESLNAGYNTSQLSHKRLLKATHDEFRNEVITWTCPMEYSAGKLSESGKWNIFLNSLYCKFSEYEIQKSKRKYDVADIENWGNDSLTDIFNYGETPNYKRGIEIKRDNFQRFLDKIKQFNIAEIDNIWNIPIEEPQLEKLNHILNLTIKEGFTISCKEPHMFIKGDYIIMSHVNKSLVSEAIGKYCKELLGAGKLKFLNIFALHTVFFDADMTTMDTLKNLTVIAPKWQIIGSRMIDLRGKNGEPLSQRIAVNLTYSYGTDGRTGMPGRPGGNFFGIGEQFLNSEKLTILANGGNGGPGEDGNKGKSGRDGYFPTKPTSDILCSDKMCDDDKRIGLFQCEIINCDRTGSWGVTITTCELVYLGIEGSKGENGGNGGKGGIGGIPGDIQLVELNISSKISQLRSVGQNGTDGKGGIGGDGGKNGDDLFADCKTTYHYTPSETKWSFTKPGFSRRAQSGKNGFTGANSNGILTPEAAFNMSKLDKAKIINQYKSYLRENLNDHFKYYFLRKFLKHLESNDKVKSVYDTLGLADELRSLEEHFNMLIDSIDFLPFYQSLLNRINEYAQNFTQHVDSSLYKKVLIYLYTTTLGRLHNLEDDLESNLIIDVSEYLNSVKKDIEKIKVLQNAKAKEELIKKYKNEYKQQIDAKINEAKDIISTDIIPAIDNAAGQTNVQIDLLLDEIENLTQQAIENHTKLINKKQDLENMLMLQNLISGLKVFSSVLGFLGPVGTAAGSIIGIGATFAESLSDSLNNTASLKQVVPDLESLKGQIQKIRDQKISNLKKSLESISQEANKNPETFSDISVKVSNFSSRLDKISGENIKSYHFTVVESVENELNTTLQTKKDSLQITDQNNEKKKSEFVAIQNMQKAVQFSSAILDAYNNHISNQVKVSAIDDAIQQNKKNFNMLKEFEDKVYITIVPMLQNIQKDIDNIVNNIDEKSKVVLDVAKWKVKSTLKDIMARMQHLIGKFNVHGQLAQSIEKMKEAIITLIDVHEHIRDYQKEQTFANFVADINSIAVSNEPIMHNMEFESDLKHTLNDLQITLTSSIIVQRYKVAIGALKQFVFPFADMYLRDLVLPTHLEFDPDKGELTLQNLIDRVVMEIENIKSKLDEYKQTIRKNDACTGYGEFTSNYKSTEPFFEFKRSEYAKMISKLLLGENVTVIADITQSSRNKDAIKFNVINFHFKAKYKQHQSKLDNILKGFRIIATHLGNSYYRYNNKIYLMTTPIQKIWYHFETNEKGEPVHRSTSYDKIKEGDFMLSPYATWKIRLDPVKDSTSFSRINKFRGGIELAGKGPYIDKENSDCEPLNVDKYYKAID